LSLAKTEVSRSVGAHKAECREWSTRLGEVSRMVETLP
jgi:hypothetical protein